MVLFVFAYVFDSTGQDLEFDASIIGWRRPRCKDDLEPATPFGDVVFLVVPLVIVISCSHGLPTGKDWLLDQSKATCKLIRPDQAKRWRLLCSRAGDVGAEKRKKPPPRRRG